MRSSLLPVVLVALASFVPSITGCSADRSEAALTPIAEGTDDVVSASRLHGDYVDGQGRFASLSLARISEGGKTENRFEGAQIVQCVRAPCPTIAITGRWFASADVLTLYPEGAERETYRASLDGPKLTLSDGNGTAVAELIRARDADPSIATVLAKYGVPEMTVDIDQAEADAQATAPLVTVPFENAFDLAMKMFLEDEMGLSGMFMDLEIPEPCAADPAKAAVCLANRRDTSVSLLTRADGGAPDGETAADTWIFSFHVGSFTDHAYYAVIEKHREEAHYIYNVN